MKESIDKMPNCSKCPVSDVCVINNSPKGFPETECPLIPIVEEIDLPE